MVLICTSLSTFSYTCWSFVYRLLNADEMGPYWKTILELQDCSSLMVLESAPHCLLTLHESLNSSEHMGSSRTEKGAPPLLAGNCHMEGLLSMGFTCGIKGSLQSLHKSLDFRHILLQGLSSKEGVDFGSFMTMFTIYCHQPGKSMINYFRGEESNTNSLGNAHKPQKLVFQRSLVAFDIFNALLLPTTSASGFSGLKTQNPGKHTYFLKCISW